MPRRLKPYKVSEEEHGLSGVRFDVFLDRNEKDFFAEVFGLVIRDPTERGCRQKALDMCAEQMAFEWRKIVVVRTRPRSSFGSHASDDDGIYVEHEVHEVADRCDGNLAELEEGLDEPEIGRYYGAAKSDPKRGVYVMPHSDGLVAALDDISSRIAAMRKSLNQLLLRSPKEIVAAASGNMLMPPAREEGEEG